MLSCNSKQCKYCNNVNMPVAYLIGNTTYLMNFYSCTSLIH